MITLQNNLGLINFGKRSERFYSFWHDKLDYINTTMRSIRKVQTDCTLLNACVNDKTYLDKTFTGYIFDKIKRMDVMYQCMLYLDVLKMFEIINDPNSPVADVMADHVEKRDVYKVEQMSPPS